MSCSRHQGNTTSSMSRLNSSVRRLIGLNGHRARQLLHLRGLSSRRRRGVPCLRPPAASVPRRSPRPDAAVGPVHLVEVDRLTPHVRRLCSTPSRRKPRWHRAPRRCPPDAARPWSRRSRRRGGCRRRAPRPAGASESPNPYAWAVSKNVTPASSAARTAAIASSRSTDPQLPAELPGAEADPRTFRPRRPSSIYSIRFPTRWSRSSP